MKILHSAREISQEDWSQGIPSRNPFLQRNFFLALEESGSIGQKTGWSPFYIHDPENKSLLLTFIKNHSYGEYIFDWEWARAYQQNRIDYYPKFTSMIPFTPVTIDHFPHKSTLKIYHQIYETNPLSSSHFLFITPEETETFAKEGYLIRESTQYHFFNESYKCFDDLLSRLKTKKAKNIRNERVFTDLNIQTWTGTSLTLDHAEEMYRFYQSTMNLKGSIDYLKKDFFLMVFETMKDQIFYVNASLDNKVIAGSLFFFSDERLYGRYWGSTHQIPNLHFELCYYQGIDFCIQKGLKVFEAGAQGEHKIPRGFRPIRTFSAHKLKNEAFQEAISRYIEEEKLYISDTITELSKQLPFKEG